jgi:hypothetical protein
MAEPPWRHSDALLLTIVNTSGSIQKVGALKSVNIDGLERVNTKEEFHTAMTTTPRHTEIMKLEQESATTFTHYDCSSEYC